MRSILHVTGASARILTSVLVLGLSFGGGGCRGCRKETASGPSPTNDAQNDIREGACAPDKTEPWPDPTYVEPTGQTPFGVYARGSPHALHKVGTVAFVALHPKIYVLDPAGPRSLVPLPSKTAAADPVIEVIAGREESLVAEIDKPRHYSGPSEVRERAYLEGGRWRVTPLERREAGYRVLTWADGRPLVVHDDRMTWLAPSEPAPLDLGLKSERCAVGSFRFIDGAEILGDATYVFGRSCSDASLHVMRFDKGSLHGEAASAFPFDFYSTKLAIHADDERFAAADCPSQTGCYARFGPKGWERAEGPPITPRSLAYAKDGVLWLVVGGDGDVGSASAHGKVGPSPLGEVHRRGPKDREWMRVPLPHAPIGDGWNEMRFVAEKVVTSREEVWVSGFWFYVRKPKSTLLQTKRRWALLRLGHQGAAAEL
jgi:hypothetical protein